MDHTTTTARRGFLALVGGTALSGIVQPVRAGRARKHDAPLCGTWIQRSAARGK